MDCLYRFVASPVILHCFVEKLAISSGISLTRYLSLCLSALVFGHCSYDTPFITSTPSTLS
jgi:hypothetical protein